jgi:hypothetical protein
MRDAALIALLLWFAAPIIRVERFRYAAALGICDHYAGALRRVRRNVLLERTETRTSAPADLAYGLRRL